jgi:hypothetical protein
LPGEKIKEKTPRFCIRKEMLGVSEVMDYFPKSARESELLVKGVEKA